MSEQPVREGVGMTTQTLNKYVSSVQVEGLGEVPHVRYQAALVEVIEAIRQYAFPGDRREDAKTGHVHFQVEVEAADLWDAREALDNVKEAVESTGYNCYFEKPVTP